MKQRSISLIPILAVLVAQAAIADDDTTTAKPAPADVNALPDWVFLDDFWSSGASMRRDDDGRLVYVVRAALVPAHRLAPTSKGRRANDFHASGANGYFLSGARTMRTQSSRVASPAASSGRATVGSSSRAGSTPAASGRTSAPGAPVKGGQRRAHRPLD